MDDQEPEPITFFLVGSWFLAGSFGFGRSLCSTLQPILYSQVSNSPVLLLIMYLILSNDKIFSCTVCCPISCGFLRSAMCLGADY
jgi:hypothetical protein